MKISISAQSENGYLHRNYNWIDGRFAKEAVEDMITTLSEAKYEQSEVNPTPSDRKIEPSTE